MNTDKYDATTIQTRRSKRTAKKLERLREARFFPEQNPNGKPL